MPGDANWNALDQLFRTLDVWRHLPDYQLERRADIFFTPYLPGLIASRFGKAIHPVVVPEFPLKKTENFQSNKVDYVLFAQDQSEVFFVELKTDLAIATTTCRMRIWPRRSAYDFDSVLLNLAQIFRKTNAKEKYLHLLYLLQAAGQIHLRDDLTGGLVPATEARRCVTTVASRCSAQDAADSNHVRSARSRRRGVTLLGSTKSHGTSRSSATRSAELFAR